MDDERKARRDRDDSSTDIPHPGGHRPSGGRQRGLDAGLPLPSDGEPSTERPEAGGSAGARRAVQPIPGLDGREGERVDRGAPGSRGGRGPSAHDVGYLFGRYVLGPLFGLLVASAIVGGITIAVVAIGGLLS